MIFFEPVREVGRVEQHDVSLSVLLDSPLDRQLHPGDRVSCRNL